jgi:integrase
MPTFDPEMLGRLLKAAASSQYGTLVYLAVMTGMRRSEILGLSWGAAELAKGVSTFARQFSG